jgi:hypothetical protein
MGDLRDFTCDPMRQLESDLGTQLDWGAVDHYNGIRHRVRRGTYACCGVTNGGLTNTSPHTAVS